MTTQKHNKAIGICYIGCGILVISISLLELFRPDISDRDGMARLIAFAGTKASLIFIGLAGMLCFTGWMILKARNWGRILGNIIGSLSLFSFPFSVFVYYLLEANIMKASIIATNLGVYTLWFFFSNNGKQMYLNADTQNVALKNL